MSPPRTNPIGGFTLIEVLVSLALFAFAAVALSTAYVSALDGYRHSAERRQIELTRDLVLAQLSTLRNIANIEQGGRIRINPTTSLAWRGRLTETEVPGLYRVRIETDAADSASDPRSERLLLYRPDWLPPEDRPVAPQDAPRIPAIIQ